MDQRLEQKIKKLQDALSSLESSYSKFTTNKDDWFYKELRDSVVKRFEYTIDYIWKVLRLYLEQEHQLMVADSPKKIFDQAKNASVISEDELRIFRNMLDERNNTSHMYNEEVSENLMHEIEAYIKVMNNLLQRMKKNNQMQP